MSTYQQRSVQTRYLNGQTNHRKATSRPTEVLDRSPTYISISYHTKEYEEGRPLRKHMESIKLPKVNGAQATYAITQQKSSKTKHNPRMHPYAPAEQNHIYIKMANHIITKEDAGD